MMVAIRRAAMMIHMVVRRVVPETMATTSERLMSKITRAPAASTPPTYGRISSCPGTGDVGPLSSSPSGDDAGTRPLGLLPAPFEPCGPRVGKAAVVLPAEAGDPPSVGPLIT